MATSLLRPTGFVTDLDGGIIILPAVEIARRRDRAAKRARDGAVALREETDARGWSSAVLERSLALRRRRGPASCPRRGRGWVVGSADPAVAAEADEHGCPRDEAATPVPVALVGGAATEMATDDSSYNVFFYPD